MSLLTQASLVLTPNAYKAGTLYSIIPSNGNGDMTVTRATTATRTNSSGVIETVNEDVPRLNYTNGVANILLEPSRTNRLLNSDTVATQTISTSGLTMAVSFYGTGTITFSGTYTGSLVGTGVNNRLSVVFTPTTGSLVLTVSGIVTKGQVETGSYVTSYIPTTSSSVIRNADTITRNNIYTNGLITSAGGTWFIELNNNFSLTRDAGTLEALSLQTSSTSTDNALCLRNNVSPTRLTILKRIATTETILYNTLTDTIKVAFKWNGVTADVYVNGTKIISATAFTTTNMDYLISRGLDVPKYIKSMMLFPTPLTDAECAYLTTL